jgi:hypothetical protein
MTEGVFIRAVMVVACLAVGAYSLWPRSQARRNRRVERWARRNLATLSPQLFEAVDRSLTSRYRAAGIWTLLGALTVATTMVVDPLGTPLEMWLVIVGLGIGTNVSFARQLSQPWTRSGQRRTVRPRAVGVPDYVPSLMRYSAWAGGVVCLVSLPLLGLTVAMSPRLVAHAGLAIGVLAALGVAEWSGRQLSKLAQPAGDEAELYAQDAWRADLAQTSFRSIALWAGFAATLVGTSGDSLQRALGGGLAFAGLCLLALSIGSQLLGLQPSDRVRARLWPHLKPGEFVGHHRPGVVTP